MSSDGELYMQECEDFFRDELDKTFGKDAWRMETASYWNFWDMRQWPDRAEVNILDSKTDEVIGKATIVSKWKVVDYGFSKGVEPEPHRIEIVKKEQAKAPS